MVTVRVVLLASLISSLSGAVVKPAAVVKPQISSFQPSEVNVGTFTLVVTGSNFVQGSVVNLNGVASAAKLLSSTQLSFTATANTPANLTVTVSNPAPTAATSNSKTLTVMPPIAVDINTDTVTTLRAGTMHKFAVAVTNALDHTVTWSVNGITGGNASIGTVASDGTYKAPPVPPSPSVVQVAATSTVDKSAKDTASVTLINPIPVITSVNPDPLVIANPSVFTINGTGFVTGAVVKRGGVALTATIVSSTKITVSGEVPASIGGVTTLTVSNPNPGAAASKVAVVPVAPSNSKLGYLEAARFLEQASWGPDPASIAHLQQIGIDAWLTEQMAAPASQYKNFGSNNLDKNQSEFFTFATASPDQLRQRVAFALSQIFVVSGLKTGDSRQMALYLNMLAGDAFGNYRTLLKDVTLSPTMGVFLDMVNNDKGNAAEGTAPNENYGREVLQLFSVGTVMLGQDGSTLPGPVLTYDQNAITNFARAFTGWTYPSAHGAPTHGHNSPAFTGPMVPVDSNHDTASKVLFGKALAAGQTASQDLESAMDAISQHPNVAPFISLRLIEHLVTSNPSSKYMTNVTTVFNNTHGDMKAVIRAILTDPEARNGDHASDPPIVSGGHLREPLLFLVNLLRTLDTSVVTNNPLESAGTDMGQKIFYPASVFNYYSPFYRIPSGILGPEFQTLSPATSLARANVVYSLMANGLDGDVRFSTETLSEMADDPALLVDTLNTALLFGRLPAGLRSDIMTALGATTDRHQRVRTALYLIASSPLYQVQH